MNWDTYFHEICITVASKSPCLSRQIGAILVRDKSIVSTGYNGPPRGIPHCGHERLKEDFTLSNMLDDMSNSFGWSEIEYTCPRHLLNKGERGAFRELCPAQHAEENCVSNAARNGVSVLGCTLYLNEHLPCSKCLGTLINAGISEIVTESLDYHDEQGKFLLENSDIIIREFQL